MENKPKLKLTTVKVLADLYKRFKKNGIDTGMNLQRLVNRSVHLYNTDLIYRERMDTLDELQVSGSNF